MFRNLSLLFFLLILSFSAKADYSIQGKINMKGDWQHQIFLATIDRLDDYYSANSEFIINVAPIEQDGSFILEGDNLPEYSQFYKLYVLKEEQSEFNACLFFDGDEHNFIHLVLDNNSALSIQADVKTYAPFGDYQISGDIANQAMKSLATLMHPSHLFYEIKFPSELKFSQDKLNRDIFNFADTCSNTLVSLAAINNSDFDAYFDTQFEQYQSTAEELKSNYPNHPYTKDYIRKMRYYGDDYESTNWGWWPFLTGLFALLSIFLFYQNRQLKKQVSLVPKIPTSEPVEDYKFTPQEIKILHLIKTGKSNKEIASELFVELSTVKSHINRIYAKFKVKNRQEAIKKARSQ